MQAGTIGRQRHFNAPIPIADDSYERFYRNCDGGGARVAQRRANEQDAQRIRKKYEERNKQRKLRMYTLALEEAVRREKEGASTRITFRVRCNTQFGQQVCIVGSDVALGMWNPADATRMSWNEGNYWTAEVDLKRGEAEYKYIIVERNNTQWEEGANHRIDLSKSRDKTIEDKWGGW
eukprot:GHVN01077931.1.p1 GENE.GHVN01077931.1~~GHVN01077931.1.p1  ORF type:complete len:197 (+),score=22.05 GHVN01077931.1:59-592(+)